ncbi:MAG TPA: hypothetical protein VNN08_20960 [Thermoanaerobaculia bacterium]|nr:hypothetical protein [Thermoanaerobaculia bacterium]
MGRLPKLRMVEVVTPEHGLKFAEDWRDRTMAMIEAFGESGVIEWPDRPRAQGRYLDIEDEILERVFAELWDSVVETFVRVAGEVLARERPR